MEMGKLMYEGKNKIFTLHSWKKLNLAQYENKNYCVFQWFLSNGSISLELLKKNNVKS
jgi:hypothetical protein